MSNSVNTTNTLAYSGRAEVTMKIGTSSFNLKVMNEGTKTLLDTITKALAGYDVTDAIPYRFDFQQLNGGSYESCLRFPLLFTGIVYGESAEATESDGRLVLNVIVTNDDKRPLSNLQNPRIVVLDKSGRVLAKIEDTEALLTMWEMITDTAEAVVKWTMIFQNSVK